MSSIVNISKSITSDLYFDIANSKHDALTLVHKFGTNDSVGTSYEDIWKAGSDLTYMTAADTMDVISSSANDTILGTGARKVFIEGLDGSFNIINEIVETNGLTGTTTINSYIRVYRAFVTEVATYGTSNQGNISIQDTTGSTLQAYIGLEGGIGSGQTQGTHYTIPAGHTAYVVGMHASIETSKVVDYLIQIRREADNTSTPTSWQTVFHIHDIAGSNILTPPAPLILPEKTDIRVRGITSSGTSACSFDYQLVIKNLSLC